jgi:hypothetical protein
MTALGVYPDLVFHITNGAVSNVTRGFGG